MRTVQPLLLLLGTLLPVSDPAPLAVPDTARLRELLHDSRDQRGQSQAALLLVQTKTTEAEEIVRQALKQTNASEVFGALATAIRLQRDTRFTEELFSALSSGQPQLLQSAADVLAELADAVIIRRLQSLVEESKGKWTVRQAGIAALGHSGRKDAVNVLLDQLARDEERVRQAAADGLAELTGQSFGQDQKAWRTWWEVRKDLPNEAWLEERLAYQASRARRLESELQQSRGQVVQLHQLLYSRLAAGDRLAHIQSLVEAEDSAVRILAITWSLELLSSADAVGQRAVASLLLRLSYDGTPEVQRQAVLGLGRFGDVRSSQRLHVLLEKGAVNVRAAAARAMAQQIKAAGTEALVRQRQVIPALQMALDDPALEVVVEAAEGLGTLGVPEAGPVLTVLLRHPARPVRQTAALALERVADLSVLEGLFDALDDPVFAIRFSLVGALGHAVGDGRALTEAQRLKLLTRLEGLLLRDADPGVRSRAATVLGECGPTAMLATLWQRVLATEDVRVQEKAWGAIVEILARSTSLDLLQEWDRIIVEAKQPARRLLLLSEVANRWSKRDDLKSSVAAVNEILVQANLDQGKWAAALPLVRQMLNGAVTEAEREKRLRYLAQIGDLALKDGNKQEVLRVVSDAQPWLGRSASLTAEFERLEKQAK